MIVFPRNGRVTWRTRRKSLKSFRRSSGEVAPSELLVLISQVGATLYGLNAELPSSEPRPAPAVPIRKSVTAEAVICLECGWKGKMLRRHIAGHGISETVYRERWSLTADHPLTAPAYTVQRSEIAKALGLGRRRSK
jgi:predicted transcriptional regulator